MGFMGLSTGLGPWAEALGVACAGCLAPALALAAVRDLSSRVIPNGCVLAVAAASALRVLALGLAGADMARALASALSGGAVVLAVMLLAAALSRCACGRQGVGGGDVKLLGALGLWLGPGRGLACVALSCLFGLMGWGLARVASARRAGPGGGGGLPLGPGIAVSALVLAILGA